ncbi:TPA: hypothetical protein DEO28_00460 [Candidatus Dependentiae bacterium]|nr:MAG: hypothetical protein UR14_C0001G0057 [candidate division TM6 bacterium GW2011_GWE2_31_21]KKP54063.1 MAG: hypothetical protein UR43_C0001G0081 [candidate division TM6 bacterium GW2011_GWF2_33_332]HBS48355.1 hypothetical protein [Candidatus Dependentiae bacterium]HBZ72971.1 hypothetical protein [Candidatus Dependentiae bacterium]
MNKLEIGFVLKNSFPKKEKSTILARDLGKIELIEIKKNKLKIKLSPGMLIAFNIITTKSNIYIVENVKTLMIPMMYKNLQEMQWMHSLLEICYYFLPLDEPNANIFAIIYEAFHFLESSEHFQEDFKIIKKLTILKLLKHLGFYPENNLQQITTTFEDLVSAFIDIPNHQNIKSIQTFIASTNKFDINLIDTWMLNCLKQHPNYSSFKATKMLA